MTDTKAELINSIKITTIHFAWDNYEFETYEKLKHFRPRLKFLERQLRVYVLTNFNTTHEQDLERIYKLQQLGYDPFIMIYEKPTAPQITRALQRWCNNKFIYRVTPNFEDYKGRKE